jgi:uncharacterized protein RhaS with RHS repeats
MPFLHVGHRYYDPASGRFLQRDPIGIRGGPNVFEYTRGTPTFRIDPHGLDIGVGNLGRPPFDPESRRKDDRERNRRDNTTPVSPEEMERERVTAVRAAVVTGVVIGIVSVAAPWAIPALTEVAGTGGLASTVAGLCGIVGTAAAWE